MEFEDALKELKAGKKITNTNWNGKGMYLFIQPGYGMELNPDEFVKVDPHIMIFNASGTLVPWLASQMDIFSDAWEVL